MKTSSKINLFILVMFITGSIDSIRNLPATALFGNALIFFFIFSAIVFLIPAALISGELAASWTEESGVFHWTRHAFGDNIGFLTIWLQWINTMVWYPTILSFIAGTFAYLIDPTLAANKAYLVSVILGTFWGLTLLNLRGLKTSADFAGICTIIGMIIPMALIIGLAVFWYTSGKPLQIHITTANLIPKLGNFDSWISLTAIMTAFLGIELASVHVKNVNHPQKNFPKAMLYSAVLILITMILGSLSIAFVIPYAKIQLVDGVMQAFSNFFRVYHLSWLLPVIATMLIIGSLGGMINWIISPAKGLMQAAKQGYLPKYLQKENAHGVPSHLLIVQAILVSLACLAFILMPSVNGSYWLLTDLSTQLYMMMYILMFASAIRLRYKYPDHVRPFQLGRGNTFIWLLGILGIIGCTITLIVGFVPPSVVNIGGLWHYEFIFSCGILILLLPMLILMQLRKKKHAESNQKCQ